MNHKQKIKMARKMMSTKEKKKGVSIFASKSWRERTAAIKYRLWKIRNKDKWKDIENIFDTYIEDLRQSYNKNGVGVNSKDVIQSDNKEIE